MGLGSGRPCEPREGLRNLAAHEDLALGPPAESLRHQQRPRLPLPCQAPAAVPGACHSVCCSPDRAYNEAHTVNMASPRMLEFADFPAFFQLLLLAARSTPRPAEIDKMAALCAGSGVDWPVFLEAALHHRVSPLLFSTLDRLNPPGLPIAVHAELQSRARANAFEALRATAEIRRITTAFGDAGRSLVVLKGLPLSQCLYSNPNTRHCGDIDLLTTPDDLAGQVELFRGLGYHLVHPAARVTPRRLATYARYWKDFTFLDPETGCEVDLHWRLFNNTHDPANGILREPLRTETIAAFNVPMRVLACSGAQPELFLYLAAHGVHDAFTYLKSLCDTAAFLRILSPEALDAAIGRAGEIGMLPQLSVAIALSNAWLGAETYDKRLLPAEHPLVRRLCLRTSDLLERQHFLPDRSFPSPANWLRLERELAPGVPSVLEMAGRFVWRPRVWTNIDLPDSLFWLYPLLGVMLPPRRHGTPVA